MNAMNEFHSIGLPLSEEDTITYIIIYAVGRSGLNYLRSLSRISTSVSSGPSASGLS